MHYEIHTKQRGDGNVLVLVESAYPKTFEGRDTTRAKQFATRGGARNYAHKWSIHGAQIVKVS